MILSADDQTLLNSLKPEFVIAAFKHKGWRPALKHHLPPRLRDAEATALIRGDNQAVVYTDNDWQTRKLDAMTAFAVAEGISTSKAIDYLTGFQEMMESEGNLTAPRA
ncbi:hypothetical protein IFO70_04745 [Phormidium tenue FACHB-886]|nr:hypothetical protein [Phormidium tenue FACHB-886]